MGEIGLFSLAIIQLITAISIFTSRKDLLGLSMLVKEQSIFRYLLTSLWLSVSLLYFIGAFIPEYFKGAILIGVANIVFEMISYWGGYRKNKKLKSYIPWAYVVMAIPLVFILLEIINL